MEKSSGNSEKSLKTDNILSDAEELREQARYTQSLSLFKRALRRCAKMHDPEGTYHCLHASGDLYRMTGNFDLARKSYMKAIAVARETNASAKVADASVGLGLSFRAQGKWKEAVKLIGESRRVYEKKHDSPGIAFTLWAEAGALRIKGDISGAIKTFRQSFKIFKALKDTQGIGYCLCGIGGASRMAGRFRDSLKYYTAANRLFASAGDIFGKAYSCCGIGNAHRMLGEYKKAFAYFKKASGLYEKIGDKVSYAYTLWGLGTAYKMTGDYKKARGHFLLAKKFFERTKDPRGIIYCELGFGEIALLEGKKVVAERLLSAALKRSSENDFALEKCHAKTLISFMDNLVHSPGRGRKRGLSAEGNDTCYRRLGVRLGFQKLPLNIP